MREMKDSGVEWIGQIPERWQLRRAKTLFTQRNSKGNKIEVLLSPTQKYGVVPQSQLEGVVQVKEDTDLQMFKTIHKGDFVISLRSFQGGFEYSLYEGVCSPAYQVFYPTTPICDLYYRYLFKSQSFISKMNNLTVGIREGKNIQYIDFANSQIPVPPIAEQERIAAFLDAECAEIDTVLEKTRASIEEYKKLKQAVITQAVTKGIRGDRPMKDSGSVWFEEIPCNWVMKRIKYLFHIKKDIAGKEGYTVLSITQSGIKPKDLSKNEGQLADDYSHYQLLAPGDFAMNHMDLLTGWVDISRYSGVTSPDYRVFVLDDTAENDCSYYLYLMQMCYFDRIFYGLGQGVSGMGRWRLQADKFLNFSVVVPPVDEQKEIASYLNEKCKQLDTLIHKKQQYLTEIENYKKSLIYEYVTGKKEVKTSALAD